MPVLTVVTEQMLAAVPGGTGRYTAQITAALAAAPPAGWTVRSVTAWHRDLSPARVPGVAGPARLPAGRRVLHELWRRGLPPRVRGDRVHACTPLAPARSAGLVVTVHDAVPWTHPETLTPRGVGWHREIIARSVRHARALVVPSEAVADDLAGIFPQAADRLVVIPHGVSALPVPPDAADRRRRLALPAGGYLLTVATREPRKGLDVLLAALGALDTGAAGAAVPLVVVGQAGWGGVDVRAEAARAGVPAAALHLLGRVDDADLAAVLDGATALVAPSRSEGFGLPVLEAFAAGVPVISSDAPALVEVAGGAAVIVRREDPAALAGAIEALLADPERQAAMAARGRERAAGYSWAAAAEALWAVHLG
ncbi:glycosyltransferase family 4 protein [Nakamurella flavida]|uniref:Glycosyltransferase family 4 protein n=1 Tax=Nakamurella flavida TaxID=363630 RepID=A0A939C7U3_9ACTN|nr:glycosyltransferase family 1 protein [Nakamurella flavida]MBM9478517.1 glycosyltransferase family 4 protein [Nakamurella flavida]MDP9777656.1 glycosyltransferase involved in cell wall biosynthesis [Nakamurella flavida]